MADEFTNRKHHNNPDCRIHVHATGVFVSNDRTNWQIYSDTHQDKAELADELDRVADALRSGDFKAIFCG